MKWRYIGKYINVVIRRFRYDLLFLLLSKSLNCMSLSGNWSPLKGLC
jgi:hypothetical protein